MWGWGCAVLGWGRWGGGLSALAVCWRGRMERNRSVECSEELRQMPREVPKEKAFFLPCRRWVGAGIFSVLLRRVRGGLRWVSRPEQLCKGSSGLWMPWVCGYGQIWLGAAAGSELELFLHPRDAERGFPGGFSTRS